MDERVRIVKKVNGQPEIRVYTRDLDQMGEAYFYAELAARGFRRADLGELQHLRSHPAEIRIPIRKDDQ
jgi:hypothetical protein